jgi:chromosome segregation protein
VTLAPYDAPQPLPEGAEPLSAHVSGTGRAGAAAGADRRGRAADGARLQAALLPGQRLVSRAGDLWRWDGFRAAAADAPSAAALRLKQLNRLVELKRDLEELSARAEGAKRAHEVLTARMAEEARAEQAAREARRAADGRVTEVNRALARAEADRSIAAGKLESARLARARHAEEAAVARHRAGRGRGGRGRPARHDRRPRRRGRGQVDGRGRADHDDVAPRRA